MAIVVIASLAAGANAIFGILLKRKQLSAPVVTQQQIVTQPFVVAMEKEFTNKREFEKFEKYVHGAHHAINQEIHSVKLGGENRDELLSKLDERTLTHTRAIDNLSLKADRIVDRVADKVEALLRNGGRQT
jgi:hypothetical protein